MTETRTQTIERLLGDQFSPLELVVKDQSRLHAGHAGAKDGKGHFAVTIVSAAFQGLSRIQRHRAVFDALGDLMDSDIHALSVRAKTPDEP